jgi:flagellar hook-basal body complex protein FliE
MDAISALRFPSIPAGGLNFPEITPPKIAVRELPSLGGVGAIQPQTGAAEGRAFSDLLGEMVRDVNARQANAGQAVEGILAGENVPLHQAMIAVEEASVSFQLMVEVRNKLIESYQELMRMQI